MPPRHTCCSLSFVSFPCAFFLPPLSLGPSSPCGSTCRVRTNKSRVCPDGTVLEAVRKKKMAGGAETIPGRTRKQSKKSKSNPQISTRHRENEIGAAFGGAWGRFAPRGRGIFNGIPWKIAREGGTTFWFSCLKKGSLRTKKRPGTHHLRGRKGFKKGDGRNPAPLPTDLAEKKASGGVPDKRFGFTRSRRLKTATIPASTPETIFGTTKRYQRTGDP